jgi:hypothetical protein
MLFNIIFLFIIYQTILIAQKAEITKDVIELITLVCIYLYKQIDYQTKIFNKKLNKKMADELRNADLEDNK